MPFRVKGKIALETRTVYYDNYQLPIFGDNADVPGSKLPLSLRDAAGKEIAATSTQSDGSFEFELTRLPLATDWISIVPTWYFGGKLKFAVLKASVNTPYDLWEWNIKLKNYVSSEDPGDMGNIRITIEQASGGLYLYQQILQAFQDLLSYGFPINANQLPSLAVLWAPGIIWPKYGTAFEKGTEQEVGKTTLSNTMYVDGAKDSESAWGYPTIMHEFGHFVLSQKRDNTSGGAHFLSSTCEPNLAWSEGWATFYYLMMASLQYKKPVTQYWRLITSGSYWLDYARLYDGEGAGSIVVPQPVPDSEDGMRQLLGEGWVTYMSWDFFDGKTIKDPSNPPDNVKLGSDPIFNALASDRYLYLQYYNDGRSDYGSDFVDYIDALVCDAQASGDTSNANAIMDLLIERKFPYDRSPVCERIK